MPTITIRQQQKTADGFSATVTFDNAVEFPVSIVNPFTPEEEKRLEWYFEQWLRRPILDTVKADAAMKSVAVYGETLFHQVFSADHEVFAEYSNFRKQLSQTQIEIVGDDPDFHALHWEALKDPKLPRPMAVDAVMLRKTFKPSAVPAQVNPSSMLNVLVVVARPDEEDDVGYRTISRPLFETIRNAKLPVNIELLRPGTFESLSQHLEEKGAGYYHIIHFDTHGKLCSFDAVETTNKKKIRSGRSDLTRYDGLKPFLILEGDAKGQCDLVEAAELADLLTGKQIPVCILNACQSGKQVSNVETYRETSLGSHLMRAGMQMVVAMGYTVTVSAARILMEHLYRHLFEGKPFPQAIQLGRKELYNRKDRTSGFFRQIIKLEDWLLPVAYSNRPVQFDLRTLTLQEEEQLLEAADFQDLYPTLTYGFFGRDLEILKIEKALLRHNMLLLRGMGGTGKTTLLLHLQRWWKKTHFVQRVFYFGYDASAWTLSCILPEIGKQVFDRFKQAEFRAMNQTDQVDQLVGKFRSERYALILDNLESITGQSLAIPNTLPPAEQELLRDFLAKLAGGKSYVVFGSRSEESWLQKTTFKDNIYHLRGLDPDSRSKLAEEILKKHVPKQEPKLRKDADFERLMKLLAGYPLAMEVILPNLKDKSYHFAMNTSHYGKAKLLKKLYFPQSLARYPQPKMVSLSEILVAFSKADIHLDTGKNDKTKSILKCVEYSYNYLSVEAQQLLLCLAPFTEFIDQLELSKYVKLLQDQELSHQFTFDKFNEALKEAIHWGLLEQINSGRLSIQPVLPYFLKHKLNSQNIDIQNAIWQTFVNHYQLLASSYENLLRAPDPKKLNEGKTLCNLEYENLYSALNTCLEKKEEFGIVFCLGYYFDAIKDWKGKEQLFKEVFSKIKNYSLASITPNIEYDIAKVIERLAACKAQQANSSMDVRHAYLNALEGVKSLSMISPEGKELSKAVIYHQLGREEIKLRNLDKAELYFYLTLNIGTMYDDHEKQAAALEGLGDVALERREFDEASKHFSRVLTLYQDLNYQVKVRMYQNLGRVATELHKYTEAKEYYQEALISLIINNDRYSQAIIYLQLGQIVTLLEEYQAGRSFCEKALDILREYEDFPRLAACYHGFGLLEYKGENYLQAEEYFNKALIYKEDERKKAESFYQLGMTRGKLKKYDEARKNYNEALSIYGKYKDELGQSDVYNHLGRLERELKNYDLARQHLEKAREIARKSQEIYKYANACGELGVLEFELNCYQDAKILFLEALKNFSELDSTNLQQRQCLHNLFEIYQKTKDEEIVSTVAEILKMTPEQVKEMFGV